MYDNWCKNFEIPTKVLKSAKLFEGPKLNLDSKLELKPGCILDQLSYKMDCEIVGGFKNRDATEFLLIKPDNF